MILSESVLWCSEHMQTPLKGINKEQGMVFLCSDTELNFNEQIASLEEDVYGRSFFYDTMEEST